jgi:hypothetical protein
MSETNEPPEDSDKPRRLSFREANLGREPAPPPPKPPGFFTKRKRTVAISLLAVGAGAAAIYGVAHRNNCDQYPPDQIASCTQRSGSGSGHYFGSFGSSSGSSSSDASSVSRGGFGSTGSAHGSGGE